MDIYSIGYLNRVIDSLRRPQSFFLDQFFSQIENSDGRTIYFDVERDGDRMRMSPVVHPLREAKLVEEEGYETKSFDPAYIKDLRVHDATRVFKRAIGEQIGTGALSPEQRRIANLTRSSENQVQMLTNRLESWAIEALTTGQVEIDGDGFNGVVDFGRNPDLTVELTGTAQWDQSGATPTDDLEDWAQLVFDASGSSVTSVIMDGAAWRARRKDEDFLSSLDMRRVQGGQINLGLMPANVQYKGNDGTFDYWVYAGERPTATTATHGPRLPYGSVLLVGDIAGVRHFAAIWDEEAGFQAREYFQSSWIERNPSRRMLQLQSAPLVVPYRPNASLYAKVISDPEV